MGYTILVSLLSTVIAIAIAVAIVKRVRRLQPCKPRSLSITLKCDMRAESVTAWADDFDVEPVTLPITAEHGVGQMLRWVGSEFGFEVETASVKKGSVKWITFNLKGRD